MHEAHTLTQGYIRLALYLGVFALLGAGVLARYVGPELARLQYRRLGYLLLLGFGVALASSLYGVYHITWMLGDTGLMWSYLTETTQGTLLLARGVFLVGLLGLWLGRSSFERWLYPPLALGLLLSIALTSHSGAAGGAVLWVDLVHLGTAAVWAGSVMALAVAWPGSRFEAVKAALGRLSRLGLPSVLLLSLAGLYLGLQKLGGLANLTTTDYGRTLLLKLVLVLGVIGLAAFNRLWLLPRFQAKRARGLHGVSLEALLIAAVLVATGFLASTPLPPPQASPSPQGSLFNISETINGQRYIGQVFSAPGIIHFYLDIRDAEGNLLPSAPPIPIRAQRGNLVRQENSAPYHKSQYHSALLAEGGGTWTVTLELGGKPFEYTLTVPE